MTRAGCVGGLLAVDMDQSAERLLDCAQIALMRICPLQDPSLMREGMRRPTELSLAELAAHYRLSPRQSQVLGMLIEGSSPKEIARDLARSAVTVRRHAEEIYRKLGVRCQRELLSQIARMTAVLVE